MGTKSSLAVPPSQATAGKAAATNAAAPTQEEIAVRAYELFLLDGAMDGRALEHWLRAEEELKTRKKP